MQYNAAYGPGPSLRLAHMSRFQGSVVSLALWHGAAFGSQGSQWSCSWLSFGELSSDESTVDLMLPAGGWATFTFPTGSNTSSVNYRHNLWLEKQGPAGAVTSLLLHYPDGSQASYATADKSDTSYAGLFYLSSRSDPSGSSLTFAYNTNFYLTNVTAADGTTFALYFENARQPSFVTSVTNSYGGSASFDYDFVYAVQLVSITDAAGITSQVTYVDIEGDPNQLVTPYGTTTFDNVSDTGIFDRIERITLPNGTQEFHASMNSYSGADWPNFATSQIPTNTPLNTLDTNERQERNTFYWNPQQFAPYVNTALTNFNWSALKRARIRHWLASTDNLYTHWDSLSVEQLPSPDGTNEGATVWYDYIGKPANANYEIGTQIMPSVVARVMPDGTTWYQYAQYTTNGLPTLAAEKWARGNTAFFRTNFYLYAANNVDLVAATNALGVRALSNVFNAFHQVTTNYDALNQVTVFTYDPSILKLTSISRPSGLTTTNIYGSNHRLQQTIDLDILRTNSYTWYANGNVQTQTDERGLSVTYFWDGLNRLTGTSDTRGTTTNLYYLLSGTPYPNSSGGLNILDRTATRDRMGYWTYFVWDPLRRLSATTNANNVVTGYGYCDCGAVTSVTNAFGTAIQEVTQYVYDQQSRLIQTTLPDGSIISYTYDDPGRLTVTTDGWGSATNTFDNLGRLLTVSNAFGQVQAATFDLLNRATNTVDRNGVTVTNTFDNLNRLLTRGYPDGGVEKFGYSARGLIAYTNQIGASNFFAFDPAGRKTFETNANNELIRYTNNAAGDLLSLTDGKNQTTRWNYDQYGRVTNKLDQAGLQILIYSYDADDRLLSRWSAAKGTTYYTNDAVGNLTFVNYPASHGVVFQYDALNRLTNMVDGVGVTKYTYFAGGQLQSEDGPWANDTVTNGYSNRGQLQSEDGPWANDTVTNGYSNRLRTSLGLQQPTGNWTNGFGYDSAKRLTNVTSQAGSFGYAYLPPRSLLFARLALPNGAYITNTFDTVARLLTNKLNNSSQATLDSYAYIYNPANQRTNQTRADGSYYGFVFDKIGQLTVANSTVNTEDRGYVYDAAWNLSRLTNNGVVVLTPTVDSDF